MPKLIAKAAFTYANRALKEGDEFDATDKDANILKLTKRAIVAGEPEGAQLDLAGEAPRRGRYSRRDMRSGN